uniref:p-granule-associated protein DEPS-1 second OB-fold domain-containing protein n=1 Tax=Setaria digitata TaxID=48799 RepID=A0A915PU81_9BILA
MPRRIGLISHQSDTGLLYVFVPGKHPDLIIDQRKKTTNEEQRFNTGDFISFIDVNGSITSPTRINNIFETRFLNDQLQVKVSVAFPPLSFCKEVKVIAEMLAWSPDFAFVGCCHSVSARFCRNQMYMAWIERVPKMTQNIAGIFVAWQVVGDILDECDEQSKQLIVKAPWNKKRNNECYRSVPCRSPAIHQKPLHSRRVSASLKKYIDNYEGLVTAVHDSSARVWSLAIPDSDVIFLFGAREGMKVGDWVQFNCAPFLRPYLNCYLYGKKFVIIEPVLPSKAFNKTVQVEVMTTVTVDNLKYYPTGEVTVETESLGAVEFKTGKFRQDYCDRCLCLAVCKNIPSKRTGAVWQVLHVMNEESNPLVHSSKATEHFTEECVCTIMKDIANGHDIDDCHSPIEHCWFHGNDGICSGKLTISFTKLTSGKQVTATGRFLRFAGNGAEESSSHDVESVEAEEEYDPLKEFAFGAVRPRVLQMDSSDSSGTDVGEKLSENGQNELDNRATEYWIRAWQIPAVRRQIVEADEVLYANLMELMTDLNARINGDSLEETLKLSEVA